MFKSLRLKFLRLEIKVCPRLQETEAHGFHRKTSTDVTYARARLKRKSEAFYSGNEKFGADQAQDFYARALRFHVGQSEGRVEVHVRFVKKILEYLSAKSRRGGYRCVKTSETLNGHVFCHAVFHAYRWRRCDKFVKITYPETTRHVASMRGLRHNQEKNCYWVKALEKVHENRLLVNYTYCNTYMEIENVIVTS